MDQDPASAPPPSGDGKHGIFNRLNGTIAGLTGLVIAIGGLAATWDRIFPAKQAEAAAPSNLAEAEAVPVDETAAATEESPPEHDDPTLYTGQKVDGGKVVKLEWDGEGWTLTEGDDTYGYDDTLSPDPDRIMAVSNGHYLPWPAEGGEVDESEDKVKWKTYATVEVAEPS